MNKSAYSSDEAHLKLRLVFYLGCTSTCKITCFANYNGSAQIQKPKLRFHCILQNICIFAEGCTVIIDGWRKILPNFPASHSLLLTKRRPSIAIFCDIHSCCLSVLFT